MTEQNEYINHLYISFNDIKKLLNITNPNEQKKELLSTLNISRKIREQNKDEKVTVKCRLCFGLFDPKDIVPLYQIVGILDEKKGETCCKHKICYECFKQHVQDQIHSPQVFVTCPVEGCGTKFKNPEKMREMKIIDTELMKKYQEKLFKKFQEGKVFKKCPMCNCVMQMKDDKQQYTKTFCQSCKKYFCFQCDCEWHEDYKCQQWQNRRKMAELHPELPRMYEEGLKHIKMEAEKDSNIKVKKVQFNSNILKKCDAWEKFLIGWKEKKCTFNDGFYCWHGSSEAGVKGICIQGFDPNRRGNAVGQVHGIGEYFGIIASHSKWYVDRAGSYHMILTFAIRSTIYCTIPNKCHVIRNDDNWRSSYCLPLFVVPYSKEVEVDHLDKENPF